MANAAISIHEHLGVDKAAFTKQLKGGGNWDELVGIEESTRTQIANSSIMCRDSYVIVTQEGVHTPEYLAVSKGVMRDLQLFADRLNVLISRRNGRTKQTLGPDEYSDYMAIGLELATLTEDIQVVVSHSMVTLIEYSHLANERIAARQEAESATNPAVVTDVEIKS